ncbi:radical SAM protein [Candidatus Woesearchaeota archaeon]|nr:radical SAM protein [Candidatus Woesearchaeota archaeon]
MKGNIKLEEYLTKRISNSESYEDLLKFPRYLEIETLKACNARCPMCPTKDWGRKPEPISDQLFKKIADEIIKHANQIKRVSLYRDGEPLLDKKLADRVAMLKKGHVKDIAISTNVSLLTESKSKELLNAGIDLVILSIDSLYKETYENIRVGLKFDEVIKNALRFIELRNRIRPETKIWIRMIRQKSNFSEWPEFKEHWSKKVSENDRVYYHNIFNWGGQLDNFKPIAQSFEPNLPCVALWSLMVIFSNGDVPLCNVDFKNKHPVGNVESSSIEELWKSKLLNQKRELHLNRKKSDIDICQNCNVWDEPTDKESVSSEYADKTEISDRN